MILYRSTMNFYFHEITIFIMNKRGSTFKGLHNWFVCQRVLWLVSHVLATAAGARMSYYADWWFDSVWTCNVLFLRCTNLYLGTLTNYVIWSAYVETTNFYCLTHTCIYFLLGAYWQWSICRYQLEEIKIEDIYFVIGNSVPQI